MYYTKYRPNELNEWLGKTIYRDIMLHAINYRAWVTEEMSYSFPFLNINIIISLN